MATNLLETVNLPRELEGTPYRFLRVLGEGGMGVVLEAEQPELERRVVVKVIREAFNSSAEYRARMRSEALSLARLAHPNVVTILDFGYNSSEHPYLVMERLEGQSLRKELANGPLQVQTAVDIACQCLKGLCIVHGAGLIHRDIKPENVFVCSRPEGLVKLLDFGLVKPSESELTRLNTGIGVVMGSPRYMSPEQVTSALVSPASDIYSLGLMLWEMVVGRHPFSSIEEISDLCRAHLSELPPPPSSRSPHLIPPSLDRIVLGAVAKRPSDRFRSARDMLVALETYAKIPEEEHATQQSAQSTIRQEEPWNEPMAIPDGSRGPKGCEDNARRGRGNVLSVETETRRWSQGVVVMLHVLPALDLAYCGIALLRSLVLLVRPTAAIDWELLDDAKRLKLEAIAGLVVPVELVRVTLFAIASAWLFRIARRMGAGRVVDDELRGWAFWAVGLVLLSPLLQLSMMGVHRSVVELVPMSSEQMARSVRALLPYVIFVQIMAHAFIYSLLPLWILHRTRKGKVGSARQG